MFLKPAFRAPKGYLPPGDADVFEDTLSDNFIDFNPCTVVNETECTSTEVAECTTDIKSICITVNEAVCETSNEECCATVSTQSGIQEEKEACATIGQQQTASHYTRFSQI